MVPLAVAQAALHRFFGFPRFRPGQVDVVESVLSGRDTLGVLPTGGGKSLCYQVPALVRPGLAIVVSPLISLMKDQVDRLVSRGVVAAFLNSTLPADEVLRCLRAVQRGTLKLLYVAPERLEAADLQRALGSCEVGLVAVDEAHCISEWGHEFRPSFRRIADVVERFGRPQIVALTATATPQVRTDIVRQLRLRQPRVIVGGFDRPNLSYVATRCRGDDDKERIATQALRALRAPAVVYAATRSSVERVARRLRVAGLRAAAYHGGMDAALRRETQERFMDGQVHAIVATNAFGMGIDKPDVRLVVHHAMPGTLEAYYQEAGRAGRDGEPARCLLLYASDDRATHEWFLERTFPDPEDVRRTWIALKELSRNGRVRADAALVARRHRAFTARRAAAAMDVLERSGVLLRDSGPARVQVRLLATPARIERELAGDADREILEALARHAQDAVSRWIALEDLPPALRGRDTRDALQRLRDRQFVDVSTTEPELRLSDAGPDTMIDWQHLSWRRKMEWQRLDAMEAYARTKRCRREVLLSYFGQRGVSSRCSGCDNCLAGGA